MPYVPEETEAMTIPGVHILTAQNPVLYTIEQVEEACRIAYQLQRGKFVLLAEPLGWTEEE